MRASVGPLADGRLTSAELVELLHDVAVPPPGLPDGTDVVRAGVRVVERRERLDLRSLAAELGIGRATLYRHAGDRSRLLGAVCAERGRRAWRAGLSSGVGLSGSAHCAAVLSAFMRRIAEDEPLHFLFRNEAELTLGLLVDPRGPVQPAAVS